MAPSPLTIFSIIQYPFFAIAGCEIARSRSATIAKRHEWLSLFIDTPLFSLRAHDLGHIRSRESRNLNNRLGAVLNGLRSRASISLIRRRDAGQSFHVVLIAPDF
jgi:hypothetical protein